MPNLANCLLALPEALETERDTTPLRLIVGMTGDDGPLLYVDIRRTPGTQLINDCTGAVIYTPPEGEARLRDMLANWERFLHNQTELDPLVRMAVGHYQFEAIHPFTDGNRRTGRVINILYLIQEDLLNLPILYLSRHVIAHKADYFGLLLGVTRDEAWEPWLQFMLQAVAETSRWTTGKIAAIRKLAEHTIGHVRARLPRIYTRELPFGKEKLFIHPKLMQLLGRDNNQFQPYA